MCPGSRWPPSLLSAIACGGLRRAVVRAGAEQRETTADNRRRLRHWLPLLLPLPVGVSRHPCPGRRPSARVGCFP